MIGTPDLAQGLGLREFLAAKVWKFQFYYFYIQSSFVFSFFSFYFHFFHLKNDHHFFFILVCSFGCWWFCYSVGGSLLVLFFLQYFPSASSRILAKSYLASKATDGPYNSCPHYSVTTMLNPCCDKDWRVLSKVLTAVLSLFFFSSRKTVWYKLRSLSWISLIIPDYREQTRWSGWSGWFGWSGWWCWWWWWWWWEWWYLQFVRLSSHNFSTIHKSVSAWRNTKAYDIK